MIRAKCSPGSSSEGQHPLRIAITGSTGLVGQALTDRLSQQGHEPIRMVRAAAADEGQIAWDIHSGVKDARALDRVDAVVHLAGENIASGRWTKAKKARILDSRVQGTVRLAETLAGLNHPPQTLVCASAIGYYGDRGDERLTEESGPGANFLADVCQRWEQAAVAAVNAGIRVVHLRFGVILSARGGALTRMLTPFKLGLGGRIGNGRQWMSWITLDDAVDVVCRALTTAELKGPVNVVSPRAVTNQMFTKILGRVLSRPTMFPLPAPIARLMLGQMADELLLASARVVPAKLEAAGYEFHHAELEAALRDLLGRAPS